MSYILDALKHSDSERQKGSIPDLQSQPIIYHRPVRRAGIRWVYLIPVAVIAFTAGYLLLPDNPGQRSVPPPLEDEIIPFAKTGLSATELPQDNRVEQVSPVELEKREEKRTEQLPVRGTDQNQLLTISEESIKDLSGITFEVAAVQPVRESNLTVNPPRSIESHTTRPTVAVPEKTEAVDKLKKPDVNRITVNKPPTVAMAESITPSDKRDPYVGVRHFKQLSSEIKREIPALTFSVHIFSDTPSGRMVKINNKTLREGGMLNGDLRLEEITKDGVIMVYRGQRFWRGTQ